MDFREQIKKKHSDPNKRRPDDGVDDDKASTRNGTEKDDKEISRGENSGR